MAESARPVNNTSGQALPGGQGRREGEERELRAQMVGHRPDDRAAGVGVTEDGQ